MRKVLLPIVALVLALGVALPTATPAAADVGPGRLWAGQNVSVGRVKVSNDADTLYVEFITEGWGWTLLETHVAVGWEVEGEWVGIPLTKKGNPKVGKFPYSDPHPPVTSYEYQIPLDWAPGTTLRIAAHAVVLDECDQHEETAWGAALCGPRTEFTPGKKGSWATYFEYVVQ